MATTTTITEGLAEIKLIDKKITAKHAFIMAHLLRQQIMSDPLVKQGGSEKAIAAERQAIHDLAENKLRIRRAIQEANVSNSVSIDGEARSLADWLVWRREVAPTEKRLLTEMQNAIRTAREKMQTKGGTVGSRAVDEPTAYDVIAHVDELALAQRVEQIESILGTLDGLLSLKNATVTITY